jgi:hypothetical protein
MAELEPRICPLSSLPLLVLAGIAEALCPHCTEDPESCRWRTPIHHGCGTGALLANSRALASLAATCKQLYAIVSPILYHQPQAHPKRHIRLLRTLVRRPDLARRVKVLRLDLDMPYKPYQGEDDKPFVLALAARHGWSLSFEPGNPEHDAHAEESAVNDLPGNLLLALCPNVEKASMSIGYDFELGGLLPPAALPHLKDLYTTHRDTEMGTCLATLRDLYLAAPNLETFTGNMTASVGGGEGLLPLGNLRHLRLSWSSISSGCLRALLQSCPRLESFSYEAGGACVGYTQFTIHSMIKLLVRYAPRLRHLDLDEVGDEDLGDEDDEDAEGGDDPEPAPGFASLSCLETLDIDFGVVDLWDEYPEAALLPESLRSLNGSDYPPAAGESP